MGSHFLATFFLATALVILAFSFAIAKAPGRQSAPAPSFKRDCKFDSQCDFKSSIGSIFLTCNKYYCGCDTAPYWNHPADVPFYQVTERVGGSWFCEVEDGGPCGVDDGLTISCEKNSGSNCTSGKCRQPSALKATPAGWACDDDLDCKRGLVCTRPLDPLEVKTCEKGPLPSNKQPIRG